MMPLAKPPFDMICIGCCTCTEYIQAAQEQPSSKEASVERREAQRVANGRGAVRTAGRTGVGSDRWGACVGGDGSSVVSARSNQGSSSAGAGGAKTRRESAFGRGGQKRPRSTSDVREGRRGKCQNRWYKRNVPNPTVLADRYRLGRG